MNHKDTLANYLQHHRIVTDGAFGTYFQSICSEDIFPEQANFTCPDLVREVHLKYLQAGARLIRTNTFAANTDNISGGITRVQEVCRQAYRIADQARSEYIQKHQKNKMREDIFIAADIGPIAVSGEDRREQVLEEYLQIADTFLETGVDAILFETFPSLDLIDQVIAKVREKSDIFIWVSMSVNQTGYSQAGIGTAFLLKEMQNMPQVDAFGFNCGVGPGHMHRSLKGENLFGKNGAYGDKFLSVLPNASYPRIVRGQVVFTKNDAYFADKLIEIAGLGASIIGGCCGTSPDTIAAIKKRMDAEPSLWENNREQNVSSRKAEEKRAARAACAAIETNQEDAAEKEHTAWFEKAKNPNGKLIAVELSPPPNARDDKVLEAACMLRDMNVDVVTFPDSPSGRTRADSILMAAKVKAKTNLRVMPHICCRDKNAIAIRAQILGAHMSDIRDFLVITGDPVPTMARESIKSVFQFDAVGLMKIIDQVNQTEFDGMGPDQILHFGGAINQNKLNFDSEIRRVKRKMEAGASYFFSQPMFTEQEAEKLRRIKKETKARIFCGIMPLISKKNALFIQNEMPGMCVTDEIVSRFDKADTRQAGEAVGVEIARQMIELTKDFADGFYFSIPFNRVYLLQDILA